MVFLSLFLAHLLGDFYFQTNRMVTDKRKYLKKHVFHHFILMLITLLFLYFSTEKADNFLTDVIIAAITITVFHYIIDMLKIMLTDKIKKRSSYSLLDFYLFIADQLLHIISLLFVCMIFFNINLLHYVTKILSLFHLIKGENITMSAVNIILFLIVMTIISTTVSGHLIRLLLGILPSHLSLYEGKYILKDVHNNTEYVNQKSTSISEEFSYIIVGKQDLARGVLIGYLERLLVIILIINGAFTSIAFIVAAKSLARFKQMDDKDFAEYFLLGTLSSILLGIVYGVVIKLVLL
ncbi:DUF3307 domain-containing protein [Metabacillus fastidiosus]|uniref:DUF3307 domain-containing protein n=1 Tax=Metabacillus fastidiosus TaxID=1458 RepID=UPI003D2D542A